MSVLVLVGSIQDSDCNENAVGTVPLEVGRVACCRTVTRVRHLPCGLGKVSLHVDDCMQVEALGRRAGKADDRVPGFDSRDIRFACSPLVREADWGAVVDLGVEEAEGTAEEDWLGIVGQPYLQEHPEVQWVIQKSGAFLLVAVELYHQ